MSSISYIVLSDKDFTKHYYAGIHKADLLFDQSFSQVNSRILEQNDMECINLEEEYSHQPIEEIPDQVLTHVDFDYGLFFE